MMNMKPECVKNFIAAASSISRNFISFDEREFCNFTYQYVTNSYQLYYVSAVIPVGFQSRKNFRLFCGNISRKQ